MTTTTTGGPVKRFVIAVFALTLAALTLSSVITVAIWPGELKLTAPLFCEDDQPETFVVSDTETSGGETTTNYTLYCVGPRGDATDAGFFGPFMVVTAVHGLLLWLFLLFGDGLGGRGHLGRTRGGPQDVQDIQDDIVPDIIADA